jgi:hypothetical protein
MSEEPAVLLPPDKAVGTYANVVQIHQDGLEAVLDFCLVDIASRQGRVECRVRCSPALLGPMHALLGKALGRKEGLLVVGVGDGKQTVLVNPEESGEG